MYPTKKQILNNLPKIRKETIDEVKKWKKEFWETNNKTENEKFESICIILYKLADLYNKPLFNVLKTDEYSAYYDPTTESIFLKKPQSIISALHELSHHLYGKSELQACRWSIAIFKEVFPKSYSKLTWKGHMLIRKKDG